MAEEVVSQPGGSAGGGSGPQQQEDRHKPGFYPTESESTVVSAWLQRVTRAEDNPPTKEWADMLEEHRQYVAGTKHKDKTDTTLVRTNMIFATIAAFMPELYAKNPTISVTPTDAVPEPEMGKVKKFAATCEKVIRKMLVQEGRLKKRSKANIRAACSTSYGAVKMTYQKEYRGDPIIIRRIEDTQDNLAKIEALVERLKDSPDLPDKQRMRDELRANLTALASNKEVSIFKGFVVDRMKSEDFLVLDDNVDEFDEYVDARALGQKVWMTVDAAKVMFRSDMHGSTKYGRPRQKDAKAENTPAGEQYVCIIEIWDKENGVVRTTAKGMNRWLREPYAPEHVSQRWYPFYLLGFNLIEGRWRPISDVELLKGLQDEYNTTRTNYADVREKAVPVTFFRKAGNLTEEDVKNIVNRGNKDTIGIEGNPSVPLSQDIQRLEGPKIDPAAYDTTMIRNDMDLVAGRSDASRANLIKPKTATEAEIMQEAMSSRVGERRDTHEDLLSEMGESALEIALNDLTLDEVRQLAGKDATWPDNPESVELIFKQVQVAVRAGSSGRPNAQQEKQAWSELLPQIVEAMKQVGELRLNGMYEQADAVVALLRETVRRFDEHLDLDAVIPPLKKDANGQPIAQQQAAMELVKTKQDLQKCQEDLAKCQQDLQKAQAADQSKAAQIEANKAIAVAQEQSKSQLAVEAERRAAAEADAGAQTKIAQETTKRLADEAEIKRRDQMERDKMASEERLAEKKIEVEAATKVDVAMIAASGKTTAQQQADTTAQAADKQQAQTNLDTVLKNLGALMGEFRDFMEADRVPEYGADGMPSVIKIRKKPKPGAVKH